MMRIFEVIDNTGTNEEEEDEQPAPAPVPPVLTHYEGRFNMCCRDGNGQEGTHGVDYVKIHGLLPRLV